MRVDILRMHAFPCRPSAEAGQQPGSADSAAADDEATASTCSKVWVLPLYAMMSAEQQGRVFRPPPEGNPLTLSVHI
jgi:HrpA-like RNA helicase